MSKLTPGPQKIPYSMDTWSCFLEKLLGHKADHPRPSSPNVQTRGSIISTPLHPFKAYIGKIPSSLLFLSYDTLHKQLTEEKGHMDKYMEGRFAVVRVILL